MKVFFNNGKYYTRVRWGTRKKDQGEVIFPLNTHEELEYADKMLGKYYTLKESHEE